MPTLVSLHVWVLHKISVVAADVPLWNISSAAGGGGSVTLVPWMPFLLKARIQDSPSRANTALLDVTQTGGMKSGETYDCVKMKTEILNNNIFMRPVKQQNNCCKKSIIVIIRAWLWDSKNLYRCLKWSNPTFMEVLPTPEKTQTVVEAPDYLFLLCIPPAVSRCITHFHT